MKNFILSLFLLTIVSCSGQSADNFSLTGRTKGIADGRVLLMRNILTDKFIDSATVKNNTFYFKTELTGFPVQTALFNEDGSDAKIMWLENKPMTFDARNSSFENALVTGSATDSLSSIHREQSKALETYEKKVQQEIKFIEKYPDNFVSAYILSVMAPAFGTEKSRELFLKFSEANMQSQYGKQIREFLDSNIKVIPQVGDKYTDFSMADQNGLEKQLSEHEGKVILLEFWASWCLPCRKENPHLVQSYKEFSGKGFEIFAVSLDEQRESWVKAIEKDDLDWIHVSDLKGSKNKVSLLYGVHGVPDNFLIDRDGILVGRNLRGAKLDSALSKVLGGPGAVVTQENNTTVIRIKDKVTWQDEMGNILSKAEAQKLLDTKEYNPHFNTEKNIVVIKKN